MRISDWSSDVCSSDLWVSHLRGAPARPRQAIGFAVARTAMRAQSGPVEGVLVGHVEPQALRRLAGVADRPAPVIEFAGDVLDERLGAVRSEEHTSELQSLMRISYAVFCLKKKKKQ